jgi:hypothetical protein
MPVQYQRKNDPVVELGWFSCFGWLWLRLGRSGLGVQGDDRGQRGHDGVACFRYLWWLVGDTHHQGGLTTKTLKSGEVSAEEASWSTWWRVSWA